LRQADLGRTLSRIRDNGRDGFYKGETARLLVEDAKANGGLLTQQDLDIYAPKFRQPVIGKYRDYEVVSMPPPSSGGVALIEMLNVLELHELSDMEPGSAAYVHLLAETMKRAFADRAQHMGDPDFVSVPVSALTAKTYAETLNKGISMTKATPSSSIKPGVFQLHEGNSTTHFSVVDKEGNAVANTYTLNTSFGSGVVATGTGVLLNNEIVLRDGRLYMVTGSPGGPTIINTVMHSILNVVEHRMTVQQAVAFPRFHHQWLPDEIRWEAFALSAETRRALTAMGHRVAERPGSIGSCHAILVEAGGKRRAGVDPRISGAGVAVEPRKEI
jgi:gamma-glutamyltranspeptidase/glutathione hydrolase